MKNILILLLIGFTFSCQNAKQIQNNVITKDIEHFWEAYDLVIQETDTVRQVELIDSLYVQRGSVGLYKIMEARNYTTNEYVDLINAYPKYWNSIRKNTQKSASLANDLKRGIEKLKLIYPDLKPAKIYFTIGAMRTNGTTRDSLVLIGSELAMADTVTDISEFEGRTKEWLETFFGSNPINGLVLLNVHEYVHTQQNEIPNNLLHTVLYEGIAEFISVKAMGVSSNVPAIKFGKNNLEVKKKFEEQMFYEWTYDWLWSSSPNEFEVRDLGYYIGYCIAENYYEQSEDKSLAIKELIELDYHNPSLVDGFIEKTKFFSKPISELRKADAEKRPKVIGITEFENGDSDVSLNTHQITLKFSEKLNGYNTGLNYSDLGESFFPVINNGIWSEDSLAWTMEVALEPNKRYNFWVTSNFRTGDNVAIIPYLIDFKTRKE